MYKFTTQSERFRLFRFSNIFKSFGWVVAFALVVGPPVLHFQFGVGFSPILTGSMKPFANPGDLFITEKSEASTLEVGDVIAVHSKATGIFYSHRITEIRPQSELLRIVTKGDANLVADVDPIIVSGQTPISKVSIRIPTVGQPLTFLDSTQGRQGGIILLVIANLIALALFVFNRQEATSEAAENAQEDELSVQAYEWARTHQKELNLYRELESTHTAGFTLEDFLARMKAEEESLPIQ